MIQLPLLRSYFLSCCSHIKPFHGKKRRVHMRGGGTSESVLILSTKERKKKKLCRTAGSSLSLSSWLSFYPDGAQLWDVAHPSISAWKTMWKRQDFCWLMICTLPLHLSIWVVLCLLTHITMFLTQGKKGCCQTEPGRKEKKARLWICWRITAINQDQCALSEAALIVLH